MTRYDIYIFFFVRVSRRQRVIYMYIPLSGEGKRNTLGELLYDIPFTASSSECKHFLIFIYFFFFTFSTTIFPQHSEDHATSLYCHRERERVYHFHTIYIYLYIIYSVYIIRFDCALTCVSAVWRSHEIQSESPVEACGGRSA